MPIVKDSISQFIGGVSQQTDKLMFPNQSRKLENQLLDVVEGLKRRPPTQNIVKLCNSFVIQPYIHTIIKEDGKYTVVLDGTTCKVYDFEGEEQTIVVTTAAENYIASTSPLTELDAVTFADYTFILNKTKKVALKNDTYTNNYSKSALIFVKQGNYSTDYTIKIDGTQVATLTTDDSDALSIKTNAIASSLKTQLDSLVGYTVTLQGSTILLQKSTDGDFTIECSDSNGNRNLLAFYKTADTSTDLPIIAPNGFILSITQDAKDGADNYYVKFTTNDGSSFGQGTWSECPQAGIKYIIDNTTMPLGLIRQSNGTFTLDVLTWGNRLAGDEDTAPSPSFIGNTIQEINTYKGRLGFVSVDKVIYSDVNDIFSFFRKTVLTELDTDPIDIASNSKMVLLKHTLPFNQELLLTSDTAQFVLKGGDTFSNSTVSLDLATSYQCSEICKPISIGANGYFVYENGSFTRIMSLMVTQQLTIDAEDITEQCPSYLPNNVYKIVGSAANNIMLVLSTSQRNNIYAYNFYTKGGERGQSAWHKWKFKGKVLNADFDKHLCYLVVQYEDGVYFETIDFTPKSTDLGLGYKVYLDRKFYISSLQSDVDGTYFTLPYDADEDYFKIVDSRGFEVKYEISGTKCYITTTHLPVVCGLTFKSLWELPTIYVRQISENAIKVQEGTLMLRDINLIYAKTGHFIVKVEPKYTTQQASEFKFTGMISGLPSATLGITQVESGTFLIPVISRNEDITITIENDSYLPSCFLSLDWIGDFTQRGR